MGDLQTMARMSALEARLQRLEAATGQVDSKIELALSTLTIGASGCQVAGQGRGMKIIVTPPQGGTIQAQGTCDPANPGQIIINGTVNIT